MGMGGGGIGSAVSEINVTPLIDVLLVLLIIFMVIVPVTPHGLDALIPQPAKDPGTNSNPLTIVVSILGTNDGQVAYKINEDTFAKNEVAQKLASIFASRQDKVMFVMGDPNVLYEDVATVIDFGHQAGVNSIGIITPKVESGQ